jgi:hypothetical protein
MMRRISIVACTLVLAVTATAQSARAPEYEVKAAFLYNFAKFVDWPSQAFPSSSTPLHICVLGRDPFGDTLSRVVQGKSVSGRPIISQPVQSSADARPCDILFVSSSDPAFLKQALAHLSDRPMLTVGESKDFLSFGGMINFVLEQDRVRFEINLTAAERHHLKLSSKLLAVARVVNVGEGAN